MGRHADLHKAIASIAAKQYGVISYRQLRELGISKNGIRSRVDLGLLVRLGDEVYRLPSAPFTWELRAVATLLANKPDAVLSHYAAARLLGLDIGQRGRVDVIIPTHRSGVVVCNAKLHWSRGFGSGDVVRDGPFCFTSVPRTLVDLAGLEAPHRLLKAVDDAILRRLCTPKQLAVVLDRPASRTRKGTAELRAGLELWLGESTPKSVAEAEVLRAILREGIPAPVCQFEVEDGKSFKAVLDFAWPDRRVAVEMDGFHHHGAPSAFGKDMDRANRLVALGWFLLRTTPRRFARAPEQFFANLRESLGLPIKRLNGDHRAGSKRPASGALERAPGRTLGSTTGRDPDESPFMEVSGFRRARTRPGPDTCPPRQPNRGAKQVRPDVTLAATERVDAH